MAGSQKINPSHTHKHTNLSLFSNLCLFLSSQVEKLELGGPLFLVLVDLKAAKDTIAILTALQEGYPSPSTPEHHAVHALLGPVNELSVAAAVDRLRCGDAEGLGRVLGLGFWNYGQIADQCSLGQI